MEWERCRGLWAVWLLQSEEDIPMLSWLRFDDRIHSPKPLFSRRECYSGRRMGRGRRLCKSQVSVLLCGNFLLVFVYFVIIGGITSLKDTVLVFVLSPLFRSRRPGRRRGWTEAFCVC